MLLINIQVMLDLTLDLVEVSMSDILSQMNRRRKTVELNSLIPVSIGGDLSTSLSLYF